MEYNDVCGAVICPSAPVVMKCLSYTDFVNWLIMRGCFSASGGVPIVKAVTNI